MGVRQKVQMQVQQIQVKIDALRKERADAIEAANGKHAEACKKAADQRGKLYRQIGSEYDPQIKALEDKQKKIKTEPFS